MRQPGPDIKLERSRSDTTVLGALTVFFWGFVAVLIFGTFKGIQKHGLTQVDDVAMVAGAVAFGIMTVGAGLYYGSHVLRVLRCRGPLITIGREQLTLHYLGESFPYAAIRHVSHGINVRGPDMLILRFHPDTALKPLYLPFRLIPWWRQRTLPDAFRMPLGEMVDEIRLRMAAAYEAANPQGPPIPREKLKDQFRLWKARLNRTWFWVLTLSMLAALFADIFYEDFPTFPIWLAWGVLALSAANRCHDFGVPGVVGLALYAVPAAAFFLPGPVFAAILAFSAFGIVVVGLWPGDRGENKYGVPQGQPIVPRYAMPDGNSRPSPNP